MLYTDNSLSDFYRGFGDWVLFLGEAVSYAFVVIRASVKNKNIWSWCFLDLSWHQLLLR